MTESQTVFLAKNLQLNCHPAAETADLAAAAQVADRQRHAQERDAAGQLGRADRRRRPRGAGGQEIPG